MTPDPGTRNEQRQAPHQRDPDEQEGANRPLEPKDKPTIEDRARDPHTGLNTPVGDPDPASDTDPYQEASE